MNNLLEIKDLNAWYHEGADVLRHLSLSLPEKGVLGLIGLNGAGKTTLLNVLAGIHHRYSAGKLLWQDAPLDLSAQNFKKQRYLVFAEDDSFGYFTFDEYLTHVFASYGQKLTPERLTPLIEGFHFQNQRQSLIKDLSTGNRKKAFLITAFCMNLPLLLLDEPVNGLDFQSTEFLYKIMMDYKNHGVLLFSSHILESICLTSDQVLVLEEGHITRIFEQGNIDAQMIREVLNDDDDI